MERVENLLKISIHAPREGSDTRRARHTPGWTHFYPRSPRGERLRYFGARLLLLHFYPRSPRGERPVFAVGVPLIGFQFLSTLPARGATTMPKFYTAYGEISIHAPREGSDRHPAADRPRRDISIHAPREGSDRHEYVPAQSGGISIHAPREGSDGLQVDALTAGFDISIHAPREGSDVVDSIRP